ncbi:MAG TPA: FkbM family methyltransferase [Hyphomonadaceae bacterium]|nr:FkbM family methyltransferase [Hyphomonadaceae bacterium]
MSNPISKAARKLTSMRLVDGRKLHSLPEREHLKRLLSHLEIDCVFDVGANVGQYATQLRKQVGYKGRIISFEPIPEAADEVRRKAKRDPAWTVEQAALADEGGMRTFHVMAGSEFSSLSEPKTDEVGRFAAMNRPVRSILVATETLAEAYPRLKAQYGFRRPFLKMDTQGYDMSVLRGAGDIIREFAGFQSELSVRRIYEEATDFREALTYYQSLGFDLSAFVPNNAGHFPALIEIDCIMVRSDLLADALKPLPSDLSAKESKQEPEPVAISGELDPAGAMDLPHAALAAEAAPALLNGRTTAHRGLTL